MRGLSMHVPWFVPGLILTVAVALLAAPALSRRLGASRWVVVLLILSLGLILSATLTPLADAFEGVGSSGRCDTGRVALASLSAYGRFGDPSLNVALFLPLGFALAMLPRSRATTMLVIGSLVLPLTIELAQMLMPFLGRGCETADIIDNMTGLLIGLASGYSVKLVHDRVRI